MSEMASILAQAIWPIPEISDRSQVQSSKGCLLGTSLYANIT